MLKYLWMPSHVWDLLQDNLALERAWEGEKTRGGLEAAELTFCFGATGSGDRGL